MEKGGYLEKVMLGTKEVATFDLFQQVLDRHMQGRFGKPTKDEISLWLIEEIIAENADTALTDAQYAFALTGVLALIKRDLS